MSEGWSRVDDPAASSVALEEVRQPEIPSRWAHLCLHISKKQACACWRECGEQVATHVLF